MTKGWNDMPTLSNTASAASKSRRPTPAPVPPLRPHDQTPCMKPPCWRPDVHARVLLGGNADLLVLHLSERPGRLRARVCIEKR